MPRNAGVEVWAAMRSHISKSVALGIAVSKPPTSSKQDRRISSELPPCGGQFSTRSRSMSQIPEGCQRSDTARPLASITRECANTAPVCGGAVSSVVSRWCSSCGCQRSSPSRKDTSGAVATSRPALRAAAEPPLAVDTSRMRGSLAALRRTTSAVPSVDPSSTTMSSNRDSLWRNAESIASPIQRSTL